jgi:hypothetical protein
VFSLPLDWRVDLVKQAEALVGLKGFKMPARPDVDSILNSKDSLDRMPDASLKCLKSDEDWKAQPLQAKATISLPANTDDRKLSDVLMGIAKSAGINIICEDFVSHRRVRDVSVKYNVPSEGSAAEILRKLGGLSWFLDQSSNLLVGWDQEWRICRQALAPADVIDNLIKKFQGDGVEFDDIAPTLTFGGFEHDIWIRESRVLFPLEIYPSEQDRPLWMLYNALSDEDKQLAKSPTGLPLGKLDIDWLSDLLAGQLSKIEKGTIRMTAKDDPPEVAQRLQLFSDPIALSTGTLRVILAPVRTDSGGGLMMMQTSEEAGKDSLTTRPPVNFDKKYTCSIELRGRQGEQDYRIGGRLQTVLPIIRSETGSSQIFLGTVTTVGE